MDNLASLHRALIEAMLQSRPGTLEQPVTVAEIYQDLIPYRSVRSTLGFALNADYEHALLQLLAGMNGHARIEPIEVREALRQELESPNPNVGMFRSYAACDVLVTVPDDLDHGFAQNERLPQEQVPPEPTEPEPPKPPRLSGNWESALNTGVSPDAADAVRDFARPAVVPEARKPTPAAPAVPDRGWAQTKPHTGQAKGATANCVSCTKKLPADRQARFCPECGYDQTKRVCRSCKEPMEEGWRFCIKCGTSTR